MTAAPVETADAVFSKAFTEARKQAGFTLERLSRASGVSKGKLGRWGFCPGVRIWSEDLEAVAQVLRAPHLTTVRATTPRRLTLRCACSNTRVVTVGKLRAEIRQAGKKGLPHTSDGKIDLRSRTAPFLCMACNRIARAKRARRKFDKKGIEYKQARGRALFATRSLEEVQQNVRDNLLPAASNRTWTQKSREKLGRSKISPQPRGTFGWCRWCDFVYLNRYDRPSPYEMHQTCAHAFRRSLPKGSGSTPPPPPRKRGRRLNASELGQAWEMSVRHLLRGEPIGEHEHGIDCHLEGERCTGNGLALRFHLQKRTVLDRIARLIAALPPDDRNGAMVGHRYRVLRDAYQKVRGRAPD